MPATLTSALGFCDEQGGGAGGGAGWDRVAWLVGMHGEGGGGRMHVHMRMHLQVATHLYDEDGERLAPLAAHKHLVLRGAHAWEESAQATKRALSLFGRPGPHCGSQAAAALLPEPTAGYHVLAEG